MNGKSAQRKRAKQQIQSRGDFWKRGAVALVRNETLEGKNSFGVRRVLEFTNVFNAPVVNRFSWDEAVCSFILVLASVYNKNLNT